MSGSCESLVMCFPDSVLADSLLSHVVLVVGEGGGQVGVVPVLVPCNPYDLCGCPHGLFKFEFEPPVV